jgi:hypothetical protein
MQEAEVEADIMVVEDQELEDQAEEELEDHQGHQGNQEQMD